MQSFEKITRKPVTKRTDKTRHNRKAQRNAKRYL